MPDRLSPVDASFLYLDETTTPMHVGSVLVFDPPQEPVDLERLTNLVGRRIGGITRYRQRARMVPSLLSPPVWVDDASFDLTYHVRRAALPRPGGAAQLAEFVARVQSRPLDRARPLWEVYLVEGLEHGRFAIVTKTHQSLVDGIHAVDVGQLILDTSVQAGVDADLDSGLDATTGRPRGWRTREPGDLELLAQLAWDGMRHPERLRDVAHAGLHDVAHAGRKVAGQALELAGVVVRGATSPAPSSPLNVQVGSARRVHLARTDLADYRLVRDAANAVDADVQVTVHDVVLTAIAGGLRTWLANRGEPVHTASSVRALVPVGVSDAVPPPGDDAPAGGAAVAGAGETGGRARPPLVDDATREADAPRTGRVGLVDRVVGAYVDLPVGEPLARTRLERIAFQMRRRHRGVLDGEQATTQAVGAAAMSNLVGFAPSTLHHLGARLASAASRRMFNLMITNVPGPQHALYTAGSHLVASYPIVPLGQGQALSIGLTSYDGAIYLGLVGDRGAMSDIDLLGACIVDELKDLVADARRVGTSRPLGRRDDAKENR